MKKEERCYIFNHNKFSCSGCGACAVVCRHNAIQMMSDDEGFLFPILEKQKCVGCGLCNKACPYVNGGRSNIDGEQHAYIATTHNKKYYKESASIGLCTMLSEYIVEQDGVVWGAFLDENTWNTYHISVSDIHGIEKIRNSKYVQSDISGVYKELKQLLLGGKMVLFVGTPCQISGVKSFLHRPFENLFTIDLVCHGVFSPKLLPLEIKYWEEKFHAPISNFKFRSKRQFPLINGGMVNFDIQKGGEKQHVERYAGASPSYRCFAYSEDDKSYNLRLSCYQCPFKEHSRYADITIGDPWAIPDSIISDKNLKSRNVIRTLYTTNTIKGDILISKVREKLEEMEFPIEKVFCQPALNYHQREAPSLRKTLFNSIDNKEYGKLVEELLNCDLAKSHRDFVKDYRELAVKIFVKTILRKCCIIDQ